ncbi:protease complex subunit PrcB family protein [Lachnospiraceae bacterium OttesenSCG-928-D06]|nr:protease complex subunit PrcB family protein [Lachnospiraceae bacterium OttesenSCG-928-D06]
MIKKTAIFLGVIYIICILCGCGLSSKEEIKLRDLDFTLLSEEKINAELMEIISERKAQPFQLTYSDTEYLYICIGYGEQKTGGYSITVDELYLTDNAIYVATCLLGPDASEKGRDNLSYPYIVIKTEFLDQTVVFE